MNVGDILLGRWAKFDYQEDWVSYLKNYQTERETSLQLYLLFGMRETVGK